MNPAVVDRQLEILFQRSCYLAEAVAAGTITLLDAVDMAQSAAEWSGVVDSAGPDAVQAVLAAAFVGTRVVA
jgi:hypothetical protein